MELFLVSAHTPDQRPVPMRVEWIQHQAVAILRVRQGVRCIDHGSVADVLLGQQLQETVFHFADRAVLVVKDGLALLDQLTRVRVAHVLHACTSEALEYGCRSQIEWFRELARIWIRKPDGVVS